MRIRVALYRDGTAAVGSDATRRALTNCVKILNFIYILTRPVKRLAEQLAVKACRVPYQSCQTILVFFSALPPAELSHLNKDRFGIPLVDLSETASSRFAFLNHIDVNV